MNFQSDKIGHFSETLFSASRLLLGQQNKNKNPADGINSGQSLVVCLFFGSSAAPWKVMVRMMMNKSCEL